MRNFAACFLWWRFSVSNDWTVDPPHKREEQWIKYESQRKKRTEALDFYVKTQCKKPMERKRGKQLWFVKISRITRIFCASLNAGLLGLDPTFSRWKRGVIYALSVLHALRRMIRTSFSQLHYLHVLVCCNSYNDGCLIVVIACSEIRLGSKPSRLEGINTLCMRRRIELR